MYGRLCREGQKEIWREETGVPVDEGTQSLKMKGQGSQQNRGTGMPGALRMGAQESLKKWRQGSLLMKRQGLCRRGTGALQMRRGQGGQGSLQEEGTGALAD